MGVLARALAQAFVNDEPLFGVEEDDAESLITGSSVGYPSARTLLGGRPDRCCFCLQLPTWCPLGSRRRQGYPCYGLCCCRGARALLGSATCCALCCGVCSMVFSFLLAGIIAEFVGKECP